MGNHIMGNHAMRSFHIHFVVGITLLMAGCGSSSVPSQQSLGNGNTDTLDKTCDNAPYPSAEWTACEQANFAKTSEAQNEANNPDFNTRLQTQSTANIAEWNLRAVGDPTWLSPQSGNTAFLPLCTTWGEQCAGDPFRYISATGADGANFYSNEAIVTPVVFYDDDCARISGRIWRPKTGNNFPAVVIQNGSVQAPETLYWWAAQALVRSGYMVMTFDPRGQGRSDQQTPAGAQGSNANPNVFWEGLVNAIDFFRSTPVQPYPHNTTCAGTYPTAVTAFNPDHAFPDRNRLGIAGHSLGGVGVSVVQSYGAAGALPWPGMMDSQNPVKAVVAWDGIFTQASGSAGNAGGNTTTASGANAGTPLVVPQFPILGINGEYGLSPQPFTAPPNPTKLITNLGEWQAAGVPAIELTIQGSTHYEFSLLPTFPATSWCPNPASGVCKDGWGNAMSEYYTLAWFDRWLKLPNEIGYATAESRLLNDNGTHGRRKMSFRYQSGRDFPLRGGGRAVCLDIRGGCA